MNAIVREQHQAGALHGAVLVADGEGVLYRESCGLADREESTPNSPDLAFPIQSITKSFTAILVLQLVQEGRLRLDGTLAGYLPSFGSPSASEITLHHLLSHTSGLPDYFLAIEGYMQGAPPQLSREEAMQLVAKMPLEFPPGSAFNYSNTGFTLLGQVVEGTTNQTYAEALRERVLEPLGMSRTRWNPEHDGTDLPHFYAADASPALDDAYFAAEGGIVSTVDDLLTFARALGSPTLLSQEMWQLAWTPHGDREKAHVQRSTNMMSYGYGFQLMAWGTGDGGSHELVGHLGSGYGSSSVMLCSDDNVLIAWNNQALSPFNPALLSGFLMTTD